MAATDGGGRDSNFEEALNRVIELMNFEEDDEWRSSPSNLSDQIFPSFSMTPSPSIFTPLDRLNSMEQYISGSFVGYCDIASSSLVGGDEMMLQPMDHQFPLLVDDTIDLIGERHKSSGNHSAMANVENSVIPRPLKLSLDEKMLRAMNLFKEWYGGGILEQLWVPMKIEDEYILSTCERPCLHDHTLSGYREVSTLFTFAAEPRASYFLGLPGHVFISKTREWTSNVAYYNQAEYLRVHHAIDHDVRGSIALPVFECDLVERSCCAVLEVVTTKEKPNFDLEMDNIYCALQAVDLSTSLPPRLDSQSLSKSQNVALAEIKDVLCAICHAHRLPLALAWIPCSYKESAGHETVRVHARGQNISPSEKLMLCIEKTACYWNDRHMEGFMPACVDHFLEEGQGTVGKALLSNQPFFCPDVKEFYISEYPLVHHARRFGLSAALAIRLRSTHTGGDDFILEFFFPVNLKGAIEQQFLLNNILNTMENTCRSLRKVLDIGLLGEKDSQVELLHCKVEDEPLIELSTRSFEQSVTNDELKSIERAPKMYTS